MDTDRAVHAKAFALRASVFICVYLWLSSASCFRWILIGGDARGLDDLRPSFLLGHHDLRELGGRRAGRIVTERLQARFRIARGKDLDGLGRHALDDGPG